MARWHGIVGYATCEEVRPGIWKDKITTREYDGESIRITSKWSSSQEGTNDNLTLDQQISIVADPFAYQNFSSIKFVEFMGVMWKVTSVNPQRPRLVLTIGGVYNGPQT